MTSTQPFPSEHESTPVSPLRSRAGDGLDSSVDTSISSHEPTRTIAILTRSAAKVHRLAITSKIEAAGFEILAERPETWETPADDDFLSAFLACEAEERKWVMRLTGAPIYVMLLERKRSAQTWLELLGPEDPSKHVDEDGLPLASAKQTLRATYGADFFYGSPSARAADIQIAIAFPEYATPEALQHLGLTSPVDENGVQFIDSHDVLYDEHGRAYDARTGEELDLQSAYDDEEAPEAQEMDRGEGSNTVYRALRLPKTHLKPDIEPRLSKAAALRMGIELPTIARAQRRVSDASSGSNSNKQPLGISGVPLADKPLPKSLSRPSLAPRLNKAAAARMGLTGEDGTGSEAGRSDSAAGSRPRQAVDFSNTPGHKRNLNPSGLASLQKPSIAPRLNKASAARIGSGSSTGTTGGISSPALSSSSSATGGLAHRTFSGSSVTSNGSTESASRPRQATDYSNTPGHKRTSVPGMAKPASLAAPSIAPRVNKAAAARMGGGPGSEGPKREAPDARAGTHGRSSSVVVDGSSAQRERKPVDYSNTPGHRRASLNFAVASLAAPSIAPRSNHANEARLAADKAREAEAAARAARRPGSAAGSRPGPSLVNSNRPGSALGASAAANGASTATSGGSRQAKVKGAAPPSSYRMASGAAPVSAGYVPARPASRA
ncbi:hypothetical protein V8E36_004256 [Tilletia maclaganii]